MSTFRPLDVVIRNGRVMDPETGYDEAGVDVGIADGKIAAIGKLRHTKGKVEIDARGMVVCPGFIEGHMHATDQVRSHIHVVICLRGGNCMIS